MREINSAAEKLKERKMRLTETIGGSYGGMVSEGAEEGKENDTDRVCGVDGGSRSVYSVSSLVLFQTEPLPNNEKSAYWNHP